MSSITADQRADRIAARATGFGFGLVAFMLTWIVSARITERVLDGPMSAYVAMTLAIAVCIVVTLWVGHRLVAGLRLVPDKTTAATTATR